MQEKARPLWRRQCCRQQEARRQLPSGSLPGRPSRQQARQGPPAAQAHLQSAQVWAGSRGAAEAGLQPDEEGHARRDDSLTQPGNSLAAGRVPDGTLPYRARRHAAEPGSSGAAAGNCLAQEDYPLEWSPERSPLRGAQQPCEQQRQEPCWPQSPTLSAVLLEHEPKEDAGRAAAVEAQPQECYAIAQHGLGQQEAARLLEACKENARPNLAPLAPHLHRRRRGVSAPPHPKRALRGAHTNLLCSLRSGGAAGRHGARPTEHMQGAQRPGLRAADESIVKASVIFEDWHPQSQHRAGTVSGACSRLNRQVRQEGLGRSEMMPAPEDSAAVRAAPVQAADLAAADGSARAEGGAAAPDRVPAAVRAACVTAAPARRRKSSAAGVQACSDWGAGDDPFAGAGRSVPAGAKADGKIAAEAAAAAAEAGAYADEGRAGRAGRDAFAEPEPDQDDGSEDALAQLLRGWVNPAMPAAGRSAALPDLALLAAGNTLGLVPQGFTREQLDAARPLRQVCCFRLS